MLVSKWGNESVLKFVPILSAVPVKEICCNSRLSVNNMIVMANIRMSPHAMVFLEGGPRL